jgi:hypothetical protein
MSQQEPVAEQAGVTRAALGASVLCLAPTIVLSVFPGWVIALL